MSAIRKLNIDLNACIGCQACTNVCPVALIGFNDDETDRIFKFAETCTEDCTLCADACSEKAITLSPWKNASKKSITEKFRLARCTECGMPHATEKMIDKLKVSIPALLIPDGMNWLSVCPACRQKNEAENISSRKLISRAFS